MKKNARKFYWAAPLGICWAIWKERNKIVFEDIPFSQPRPKHSIISSLWFWAGLIQNVENSFVKNLSCLYMPNARS